MRAWQVSMSPLHAEYGTSKRKWVGVPFNLGPDDIDDLVRQAGNVLVAQVDGDARLLLLQFPWCLGSGAVVDVLAGVFKSRLGQRHDLVIRDGRGRVVAHGERGTLWAQRFGLVACYCRIHAVRVDSDGELEPGKEHLLHFVTGVGCRCR